MSAWEMGDALVSRLRSRYERCYTLWAQKQGAARRRIPNFVVRNVRFLLLQSTTDPCENNLSTMYDCIVRLVCETDRLRTSIADVAQERVLENFETYEHIFDRVEKEFNQQFQPSARRTPRARHSTSS